MTSSPGRNSPLAGGVPSLTSTIWMSTVLVGITLVVVEPSVSLCPVRLNMSCSSVPSTSAVLPSSSPSLISLWGLPDGGL
ncbi:hypothetical protein D3C84_1016300 [compost metagenome]